MRQRRKQKRPCQKNQKRKQRGGFLNRFDFTYAVRDTVNQLGKIAPGLIKNAGSEIDNIAQKRLNQIISLRGKEVERVLPKILTGAIENVYQIPFRLLVKFGKQQLQRLRDKILR